jgi:hypothetical protein
MTLKKKFLLGLLVGVVAIQFIQPARNKSEKMLTTDIQQMYQMPGRIFVVLQISCYDCHSNNTHYPWYSFIQPGAWWMASHIKEGKANLNFSEFGTYSNRKQQSKLQAIINSINDNTMPLNSYTMLHKNAKLSEENKVLILDWIKTTKDSLSLKN